MAHPLATIVLVATSLQHGGDAKDMFNYNSATITATTDIFATTQLFHLDYKTFSAKTNRSNHEFDLFFFMRNAIWLWLVVFTRIARIFSHAMMRTI